MNSYDIVFVFRQTIYTHIHTGTIFTFVILSPISRYHIQYPVNLSPILGIILTFSKFRVYIYRCNKIVKIPRSLCNTMRLLKFHGAPAVATQLLKCSTMFSQTIVAVIKILIEFPSRFSETNTYPLDLKLSSEDVH